MYCLTEAREKLFCSCKRSAMLGTDSFQRTTNILGLIRPGASPSELKAHLKSLHFELKLMVSRLGIPTVSKVCDTFLRDEVRATSLYSLLIDLLSRYPDDLAEECDACINCLTLDTVACGATRGKKVSVEVSSSVKWELELGDFYDDWTGCRVWPGAIHLSRLLVDDQITVKGCDVLEIGSGIGLCGIACVKSGAKRTYVTEYQQSLLEIALHNIWFNTFLDSPGVASGFLLDWTNFSADSSDHFIKFQASCKEGFVVIGSEIIYEERHVDLIIGVLGQLFRNGAARGVIVVMTRPSRDGVDKFIQTLQSLPQDSPFLCDISFEDDDKKQTAAVILLRKNSV